jgi:calcineurin-like phosphoesterase
MEPAIEQQVDGKSNAVVQGIIAEINAETGKAVSIKRISV